MNVELWGELIEGAQCRDALIESVQLHEPLVEGAECAAEVIDE